MYGTPFTAQTNGLDRQVLQTPHYRTVTQPIKTESPTLQGAFDAMPAPTQVRDQRPSGTGETPLMLNKLPGHHGDQHYPNEVCSSCGQPAEQSVNRTGCQVNWQGSQVKRRFVWLRHPTSIAKPGCFSLPHW